MYVYIHTCIHFDIRLTKKEDVRLSTRARGRGERERPGWQPRITKPDRLNI